MAEEETLTSKVTIDTEGAVRSVDALEQRLSVLEAAFVRSASGAKQGQEGIKNVASEAGNSGKKAEEATGFWGRLAKVFGDVASHSRTAGMALKTAGLDAEAGAARMSGMAELFRGIGSAAPMLLGVGTAVTGIFAAFELGKSAVDKAAEWQQNMAVLGQTVKNQGGDWGKLSQSVEQWAELQERTTIYSRDQTVQALTQLTSTGMSLNDAMKTTRVAEDAAAATGLNLTDVNHALMEAMHGRTQALTQLGLGTKAQIKDGMSYNQVLGLIEKNMGGAAAAAADTYAGKMKQMQNAVSTLEEKIGTKLLPILTALAEKVTQWVEVVEQNLPRIESAFDNVVKVLELVWSGVSKVWSILTSGPGIIAAVTAALLVMSRTAMGGIATFGELKTAVVLLNEQAFAKLVPILTMDFPAAMTASRVAVTEFFTSIGPVGWVLIGLGATATAFAAAWQNNWFDIRGVTGNVINTIAHWIASLEKFIGGMVHRLAGLASHIPGIGGAVASGLNAYAGIYDTVGGWLDKVNVNFEKTAAVAKHAGKVVKQAKKDMEANPADTNTSVTGMVGGGGGHHAHHKKGPSADSLHRKEITAETKALNEKIKAIELEAKQHKITIEQEIKDLEHLLNTEKMTGAERQKITREVLALKKQEAKAAQEAEKKKQEAYKTSLDHFIKTLEEEVKTHKISHAQMAEDLKDWVQKHKDADNQILQHAQDTIQAQTDLQTKTDEENQRKLEEYNRKWEEYYNKLEANAQKWADTSMNFIEGFFQKGKHGMSGFSEEWKKMLKDMEHALLKSFLIKMFMGGKGPGFGALFAKEMGFGGSNAQAPQAPPGPGPLGAAANAGSTGAASGGVLGALIGTGNASSVAGALPTDSVMSMLLGVGFGGVGGSGGGGGLAAIFGTAGASGGSASAASGAFYGGGATGSNSGIESAGESALMNKLMSGGIKGISAALGTHLRFLGGSATGGSMLLGAAGGYLEGSLIKQLFFGNQPLNSGAQIGGTIGGALGTFGGPIGSLIGATLGSVVGGLFGNHDNPANMPDKYDTQRFGTIVSDLQGKMGANGQSFTEQSQLSSASGGLTGIQWVEETLAKYAKPGTTQMGDQTPDWLKPMWDQLVSAFGVSATGSGKLNFGHAINNENVTGAAGVDGKTYQYTDLGKMLDQFYQSYVTQGQLQTTNPNNPTNPNGSNPGFFASSPFQGVYTIGADGNPVSSDTGLPALNVLPGDTSGGASGGGTTGGTTSGTTQTQSIAPAQQSVNITIQGHVLGGDDLATRLEELLGERLERKVFAKFNGGINS